MPKLIANRVPSYRKHRQSGQAIVTLNGKDHLLGPHGTQASKNEYDRLIAEWIAGGRELPRDRSDLTIAELCKTYREHCRTYYLGRDGRPAREQDNIRLALRRLREMYGSLPAAEFGPLKLKALRAATLQPHQETDPKSGENVTRPGWCRTNANRNIDRIKALFKWGAEQEIVPPVVYQGLQAVAGLRAGRSEARESEPVKPVPEAYIDACRPFLSKTVTTMIDLQLLSGMRPGEVLAMRTGDIDTTGKLWLYKPSHHKTEHHGHTRQVYLGPKAIEIIRPFLKPDLAAPIFSPAEAAAERRALRLRIKTPLSCGNVPGSNVKKAPKRKPRNSYDVASYRRAIARAAERAQVPTWHPHQLRHNAATNLRKTYGLEAAQVILGHRTLSVTEIYAEKNVEAAQRIMAAVG